MNAEFAGYTATACGVVFVVLSGLAVLAMVKLNKADREYKRGLAEYRLQELEMLREARTQSELKNK